MSAELRFLIDQNVDDAVARFLVDLGHGLEKVRHVTGADAPDSVIAFIANTNGLILVSHDKHFRRFTSLIPTGERGRVVAGSGRIILRVKEPRAVIRLRDEWNAILFHYQDAQERRRRFHVVINETGLQIVTNAPMSEDHS